MSKIHKRDLLLTGAAGILTTAIVAAAIAKHKQDQASGNRNKYQQELTQVSGNRDRYQRELTQASGNRNRYQRELTQAGGNRNKYQQELAQVRGNRNKYQQELAQVSGNRNKYQQELTQATGDRNTHMQQLVVMRRAAEKNGILEQISNLLQRPVPRKSEFLRNTIAFHERRMGNMVFEKGGQVQVDGVDLPGWNLHLLVNAHQATLEYRKKKVFGGSYEPKYCTAPVSPGPQEALKGAQDVLESFQWCTDGDVKIIRALCVLLANQDDDLHVIKAQTILPGLSKPALEVWRSFRQFIFLPYLQKNTSMDHQHCAITQMLSKGKRSWTLQACGGEPGEVSVLQQNLFFIFLAFEGQTADWTAFPAEDPINPFSGNGALTQLKKIQATV